MRSPLVAATAALGLLSQGANAISLTLGDGSKIDCGSLNSTKQTRLTKLSLASTKNAAGTVAFGLMKFYTGNNTGDNPGNLPSPYYCQQALFFKVTVAR